MRGASFIDATYPIFPVYKSNPYQRIMSKPTVKNIAEKGKEIYFRDKKINAPIEIETPAHIERISVFPIAQFLLSLRFSPRQ